MSMDVSTVESLRQEYANSPTINGWVCLLTCCCEALTEKIEKIREKQKREEYLLAEMQECQTANLVNFVKSFLPPTQSTVTELSRHGIFSCLDMFNFDHQHFQSYPLHVTYLLAHLFRILGLMVVEKDAREAYLNSARYCLQLARQIRQDEELQPVLEGGMEEIGLFFSEEQKASTFIDQMETQIQALLDQIPDCLGVNFTAVEVDMQNLKAFHQANHSTSFRM